MRPTVYISIGNSDDKLPQAEWAEFVMRIQALMQAYGTIHGEWYSLPNQRWQNACWCLETYDGERGVLRKRLSEIARNYRQDSIAWAEATTERIAPAKREEKR